MEDFLKRVQPSVSERRVLARSGALNALAEVGHRREALWQVELPLRDDLLPRTESLRSDLLGVMSMSERLSADFATQGASTGPHPMRIWRKNHGSRTILRARDLCNLPHGIPVVVAGMAICRQRPGTAKGHCFISLEDETGIANLFVPKTTFYRLRRVISSESFLLAHGMIQRSEEDRVTVYVTEIDSLSNHENEHSVKSHDFR
jgi:error-prone DNA polymerase